MVKMLEKCYTARMDNCDPNMKQARYIKPALMPLEQRLMLDASLPAISGQVLWLDAADASTILDADGDNAADGTGGSNDGFSGSVATWQDKSTSGYDVTASGSETPLYGVDTQNGNGVITFDGVDDRLISSSGLIAGDDVTIFIVYNRTGSSAREALMELNTSGSRNAVFLNTDSTMNYYANTGFTSSTTALSNGVYNLSSIIHDQTAFDIWINGDSEVSTTTNLRADTTNIVIGDDWSSNDEVDATIAEIIVYDRALTADERHDVETYLAGKWGISITNTAPTVDTNLGYTLDEGATLAITNAELASSDADNSDGNLSYTITDTADHGFLTNTNTAQALYTGDSFTQSDLDNGYITYTHDGGASTSDSFTFTLSDGPDSVTGQSFAITINALGTESSVNTIANPVLHFDATDIDGDGDLSDQPTDGSAVSTWVDDASVNNKATSSGSVRPTYNDSVFTALNGGLTFDGVDDYLNIGAHDEVNTGTYAEKSFAFTFRTGADVVSDQIIYEQGGSVRGINFGIFGGDIYAYVFLNGTGGPHYVLNLGAASANTTYSLVAIYDNVTTHTWSASLNGGTFVSVAVGSNISSHTGAPGFGYPNGTTLSPVSNSGISGTYFEGSIGEFWSWNTALSASEAADVQDYLYDKWFDSAPSISVNNTLDVVKSSVVTIDNTSLDTDDVESLDDQLTYTLTTLPSQGTLYLNGVALSNGDTFTQDDINNNLLSFHHDGSAAPSTDSFNFTVSDGYNSTIAGSFTFNIAANPANDPSVIVNSAANLNEGASIAIDSTYLLTSDGDNLATELIYTLSATVTNGTLYRNGVALVNGDTFTQDDINNNLLTYTHNDSEVFIDSFAFTVSDGSTTTPSSSFSFSITPVNDQTPSDIALSATTVTENTAIGTTIATLTAVDADLPGDSFTYSIVSDPDSKFTLVGDELRVNGSLNYESATSHSVTLRVSDGVFTYDEVFVITISDVNEAPANITLSNTTLAESTSIGTVIGTFGATDEDLPGDILTYSITNDPDNMFSLSGSNLLVDGQLDFETSSSHLVTVQVSDGNGGTRSKNFTITVTDINDAPIMATEGTSLAQGNTITIDTSVVHATDQDDLDTGLIYTLTSVTSSGTLYLNGVALGNGNTFTGQDLIDGLLTYTHDNTANVTSDSFSLTVSDSSVSTGPSTVTLDIGIALENNGATALLEGETTVIGSADLSYGVNWYNTNWSSRTLITVDSAMVDADLSDYALLINGDNLDADFWTTVKADGSDIIAVDANGNKLDRELVTIDTVAKTLQLYVRTDLSSSVDTKIYLYYGNSSATETNDATTWSSNYVGVWHFDDDFDDGSVADSSQAGNDAYTQNGFSSGNQTSGVTGSAGQFNDIEYLALDYYYTGNNTLAEISVSAWINTTFSSGGQTDNWSIIDFDRSEFFNVFIHGNGTVGFSTTGSGLSVDDMTSSITVNDGNWHYVVAVYDGTDKILYVDGVEVDRVSDVYSGAALGQGTRYGYIGQNSEGTTFNEQTTGPYYDGLYDDIHLYEGTMSAALIAAEYRNYSDPTSFYSVSAQYDRVIDTQYTLSDLPHNGIVFIDSNANGLYDSGEALALNDTFGPDDIESNRLLYVHDDSNTTSDSFSFTVSNGLGLTTATQIHDFSITSVHDAEDDPAITPQEDSRFSPQIKPLTSTNGLEAADTRQSLQKLEASPASADLVQAAFLGDAQQIQAFYGLDGLAQIVRENTTLPLRGEAAASPAELALAPNAVAPAMPEALPAQAEPFSQGQGLQINNLREALAFLNQLAQQDEPANGEHTDKPPQQTDAARAIDQQFVDVMTYHQQKQNALKQALAALAS